KGASGALACMSGGDTLIVRGGTYNESIASGIDNIPSGSSGAPTTIQTATGETVWLKGTAGQATTIFLFTGTDYITFDGINLDSINTAPATNLPNWCVKNEGGAHIVVKNAEIIHCGMGLLWGGNNGLMQNLNIHDTILVPTCNTATAECTG